MPRLRTWSLAAAAVAAIESAVELVRFAVAGSIHGYSTLGTALSSIVLIVVLALAAVGLGLGRRFGWVAGVLGAVMSVSYGAIVAMGGRPAGALYMLGGVVILVGLIKSVPAFRGTAEAA